MANFLEDYSSMSPDMNSDSTRSITYKDLLLPECNSVYRSLALINSPYPHMVSANFTFNFRVFSSLISLQAQADAFSDIILGLPNIRNKLSKTQTRDLTKLKTLAAESYKYSYFKALFYVQRAIDSNLPGVNLCHVNCYVYSGHAMLYKTLLTEHIRYADYLTNSAITKKLTLSEGLLSSFSNDPLYKRIAGTTEGNPSVFRDVFLEDFLNDVYSNYPSVKMVNLHNITMSILDQEDLNPLGNMVYQESDVEGQEMNVLYFGTSDPLGNVCSRFWTLANNIELVSNTVPDEVSVFRSTSSSKLDGNTVYFMVQSITGLNLFGDPSGNGRSQENGSGSSPNPGSSGNPSGQGSNGPSNDSNNQNEIRSPEGNPSGNKKTNNNKRSNNTNKGNTVRDFTNKVVNSIDENLISNILLSYTKAKVADHFNNKNRNEILSSVDKILSNRTLTMNTNGKQQTIGFKGFGLGRNADNVVFAVESKN
jgi:hypothetical protein